MEITPFCSATQILFQVQGAHANTQAADLEQTETFSVGKGATFGLLLYWNRQVTPNCHGYSFEALTVLKSQHAQKRNSNSGSCNRRHQAQYESATPAGIHSKYGAQQMRSTFARLQQGLDAATQRVLYFVGQTFEFYFQKTKYPNHGAFDSFPPRAHQAVESRHRRI